MDINTCTNSTYFIYQNLSKKFIKGVKDMQDDILRVVEKLKLGDDDYTWNVKDETFSFCLNICNMEFMQAGCQWYLSRVVLLNEGQVIKALEILHILNEEYFID